MDNYQPVSTDSVFLIDINRIKPNPYQPRKSFDQSALEALAASIRQYGVLQAVVVSRKEVETHEGGLVTEYELIAGERRLRASKLAGLKEIPAIIRSGEETNTMKLELAIIENLQREDLNPIDRARAFKQLADEFGYKHGEIGKRVGKSREYVSNSIRLLALPPEMVAGIERKEISEGHARPLLMLADKPEQQETLFKDIVLNKMSVREAEKVSRSIAVERVRKVAFDSTPEVIAAERELKEKFGTRVQIEKKTKGGKIVIDFYTLEELKSIIDKMADDESMSAEVTKAAESFEVADSAPVATEETNRELPQPDGSEDDASDLYSVTNFSL